MVQRSALARRGQAELEEAHWHAVADWGTLARCRPLALALALILSSLACKPGNWCSRTRLIRFVAYILQLFLHLCVQGIPGRTRLRSYDIATKRQSGQSMSPLKARQLSLPSKTLAESDSPQGCGLSLHSTRFVLPCFAFVLQRWQIDDQRGWRF